MANFVVNEYNLDITPQGCYPVVYLSQFEDGRDISFYMLNRGTPLEIPSEAISVFVSGLKQNGGYFEHQCEIADGSHVVMHIEPDMTDVSGRGAATLTFTDSNDKKVISAKFIINVQDGVSDGGIEIPTEAETIFQQLLDEIRAEATKLDLDMDALDAKIEEFKSDVNADIDDFKSDVNDDIDDFKSDVNDDIDIINARVDNFLASQTGVSNGEKFTVSLLYNNPADGTISSYISLSDDPINYDYLIIQYGLYTTGSGGYKTVDRAIVSGSDFRAATQNSPYICNSFGVFDSASENGTQRYPLRAVQLSMWKYTSGDSMYTAYRARFDTFDWSGMEDQDSYGYSGAGNNFIVKAVYGIKFVDAGTSKDPELADIRVGADGYSYPSAGAAVRSQISQIKEDLQDISEASNNLFDGNVVNLGFSSGKVASDPTYRAFYWAVENGETYTLSRRNTTDFNRFRIGFLRTLPENGVLVYKEDGTQFTPTAKGDALTVQTVTVPSNHDYAYAMVYLSNSGQTIDDSCRLMINKGSTALEWETYFDKTAVDRVARDKLAEYDGNVGIVQRNGIAETTNKLQQLNRPTRTASRTLGTAPLCLLHFSDIHGDKKRLQNILEFKEYYSDYIADIIHTGDMVRYYSTDGITFWDEVDGAENILNVIGNHDTLVGSTWIGMTMAEAYTTYFASYISNWGVTGTSGQTYYYKDYTDNKVRLIVLDIMHQSADQLTWFTNTLASAKTANLHVVVAVHSRVHWLFDSHVTPWDDKPLVPSYTAGYNDTSASTYPENLSDDYASAVDDFINDGGYFVCWIHGHTHHKMFAQLQTHPSQLDVSVENAGIPNFAWTYVKARIDGTKSEDCFNVLAVDTDSKILRLMAVGATYDRFMRHVDGISYNYETHTILS